MELIQFIKGELPILGAITDEPNVKTVIRTDLTTKMSESVWDHFNRTGFFPSILIVPGYGVFRKTKHSSGWDVDQWVVYQNISEQCLTVIP